MESTILYWIIIAAGIPIIISITAINYDTNLIWVSAILGAYFILISVCEFLGRWPVELNLPSLSETGAIERVEQNYWIFMGFWISLSILGTTIQCVLLLRYKRSKNELHPIIKEAVATFKYGRSAHQIDLLKN